MVIFYSYVNVYQRVSIKLDWGLSRITKPNWWLHEAGYNHQFGEYLYTIIYSHHLDSIDSISLRNSIFVRHHLCLSKSVILHHRNRSYLIDFFHWKMSLFHRNPDFSHENPEFFHRNREFFHEKCWIPPRSRTDLEALRRSRGHVEEEVAAEANSKLWRQGKRW